MNIISVQRDMKLFNIYICVCAHAGYYYYDLCDVKPTYNAFILFYLTLNKEIHILPCIQKNVNLVLVLTCRRNREKIAAGLVHHFFCNKHPRSFHPQDDQGN